MNKEVVKTIAILTVTILAFGALYLINNNEKERQITALNDNVSEQAAQIDTLTQSIAEREADIEALNTDNNNLLIQIESLNADATERKEEIDKLNTNISEKEANIEALNADNSNLLVQIESLNADAAERKEEIDKLNTNISEKDIKIELLMADASNKAEIIKSLNEDVSTKAGKIQSLEETMAEVSARVEDLQKENKDKEKQIADITIEAERNSDLNKSLEAEKAEMLKTYETLEKENKLKNETIKNLQEKISQLEKDDNEPANPENDAETILVPGDEVLFGRYEQDNLLLNGTESIEWVVLDANKDSILLISKYGLYAKAFDEDNKESDWENSTLRSWLNSQFFIHAFTEMEQDSIITTAVDNSASQNFKMWKPSGSNNTEDKVFLLSYSEANKYYSIMQGKNDNIPARVAPTDYAIQAGAETNTWKTGERQYAGWWWLRSEGKTKWTRACVNSQGALSDAMPSNKGCIRPAIRLNADPSLWKTIVIKKRNVYGEDIWHPIPGLKISFGFRSFNPDTQYIQFQLRDNVSKKIVAESSFAAHNLPYGTDFDTDYKVSDIQSQDNVLHFDFYVLYSLNNDDIKVRVEQSIPMHITIE